MCNFSKMGISQSESYGLSPRFWSWTITATIGRCHHCLTNKICENVFVLFFFSQLNLPNTFISLFRDIYCESMFLTPHLTLTVIQTVTLTPILKPLIKMNKKKKSKRKFKKFQYSSFEPKSKITPSYLGWTTIYNGFITSVFIDKYNVGSSGYKK